MIIGLLTLELRIPMAHSLKDKRRVIKSLQDKYKNRYNIAVAEIGNNDLWKSATLGIVTLSNNSRYLESLLNEILKFTEDFSGLQVTDHEIKYF